MLTEQQLKEVQNKKLNKFLQEKGIDLEKEKDLNEYLEKWRKLLLDTHGKWKAKKASIKNLKNSLTNLEEKNTKKGQEKKQENRGLLSKLENFTTKYNESEEQIQKLNEEKKTLQNRIAYLEEKNKTIQQWIANNFSSGSDNTLAEATEDPSAFLIDLLTKIQKQLKVKDLTTLATDYPLPIEKNLRDLFDFYNNSSLCQNPQHANYEALAAQTNRFLSLANTPTEPVIKEVDNPAQVQEIKKLKQIILELEEKPQSWKSVVIREQKTTPEQKNVIYFFLLLIMALTNIRGSVLINNNKKKKNN